MLALGRDPVERLAATLPLGPLVRLSNSSRELRVWTVHQSLWVVHLTAAARAVDPGQTAVMLPAPRDLVWDETAESGSA